MLAKIKHLDRVEGGYYFDSCLQEENKVSPKKGKEFEGHKEFWT